MKKFVIGVFLVFLIVLASNGASASNTANRSLTISSNQIYVVTFDGSKGTHYTFNYTVTKGGPVDFIMFNESNYNLYINGFITKSSASFNYFGEMSAINATHAFLNFTLSVSQIYFLVVENANYFTHGANTIGSVTVLVSIQTTSTTPGFEFYSIGTLFLCACVVLFFRKVRNSSR